jgi:fatty acid desaturase
VSEVISPIEIRRQAWKFYVAVVTWPLYLLLLPGVWARLGLFSLLFMVFPGLYLFTWVGYSMHECWHKYVPNVPNALLYNLYSWELLTDPQLYRLTHGLHHSQVNTYDDMEFHPLGRIASRSWRILYNALEILLGVLFLVLAATVAVPRHPRIGKRYRFWKLLISLAIWVVFLGGIGYLSSRLFGLSSSQIALPYAITIWLNSFVLHQSQLVEHGNLIAEGSWEQRNIVTHNLKPAGIAEKVFLFLTHGDSREHVLHHTMTPIYLRPFPGRVPMPEGAVYITLRDYLGILRDMLSGRDTANAGQ